MQGLIPRLFPPPLPLQHQFQRAAAGARSTRSSRAGRSNERKKIFWCDYPRGLGNGLVRGAFPVPCALPVAPALAVPFLFARRRRPVVLLRLPARPAARLPAALLAAIALVRLPRMEALPASFEQTPPRPGTLPPASRLLFDMGCRTLKKAHGRSRLPEAPCPGEGAIALQGAVNLRRLFQKSIM